MSTDAGLDSVLATAGLSAARSIEPLTGGGNNRLARVETDDRPVVVKTYFHHPADPRDRLGTEFGFSEFAWSRGVRNIPRPLAADAVNHRAVYAWVDGRRPEPREVNGRAVEHALAFVARLNADAEAARGLPNASEACFSMAEHLACVDGRLARLTEVADPGARDLVRQVIEPAWEAVRAGVVVGSGALDAPLSQADRCVSPSDFGFHNALVDAEGSFWFLDFEYAGWDDPAKLVCDFFCQPQRPVPSELFDDVVNMVTAMFTRPAWHARRIELLWPVYQLKWACILLNQFLPVGSHRRRFAGADMSQQQLEAAAALALAATRSSGRPVA